MMYCATGWQNGHHLQEEGKYVHVMHGKDTGIMYNSCEVCVPIGTEQKERDKKKRPDDRLGRSEIKALFGGLKASDLKLPLFSSIALEE
jgi:hypothetical protein